MFYKFLCVANKTRESVTLKLIASRGPLSLWHMDPYSIIPTAMKIFIFINCNGNVIKKVMYIGLFFAC